MIKTHQQTPASQWDALANQIDEATYLHSWNWIQYTNLFRENGSQHSFILLDNQGNPLAICPLGISIDPTLQIKEVSLGGNPVGTPAIISTKPSLRRKICEGVFVEVRKLAQEHGVQQIRMKGHPLTQGFCKGALAGTTNRFELQKYQLLPDVDNTLVMDLSLSTDSLTENVSPYHRKHLRKSVKQGISVKAFSKKENNEELKKYFAELKQAHFLSAGKWTRPHSTWDAMLDRAEQGQATLFVAFLDKKPMSFLFCGEFSSMCFGWSQANLEEFEREYSLRHLLEWEAILYYKSRGFNFYEFGERYFGPQWTQQPTAKEISVSEFKERYGGFMLPKILWTGFLDRKLMKTVFEKNSAALENQLLNLGAPNEENED